MLVSCIGKRVVLFLFFCLALSFQLHAQKVSFSWQLDEELIALTTRVKHNRKALKKYLNLSKDIARTPNISFVLSGGGFRSMLVSAAAMHAAEQTGLLDCTCYVSSVSGSTWMLASWLSHDMKLSDFSNILYEKIKKGLNVLPFKQALKTWWNSSLVGLWGAVLGKTLLADNDVESLTLSGLQERLETGKYPFPLFSCIAPIEGNSYEWIDLSPYEAGLCGTDSYIPTQYIGSVFEKGELVQEKKEPLLQRLLGIFGSAFSISLQELDSLYRFGSLKSWICNSQLFKNLRLSVSSLPNIFYNMSGNSSLSRLKNLKCIDGGIEANLAFHSLFRRSVDVYIVCDASGSYREAELIKAAGYAKACNIPFPDIAYSKGLTSKEKVTLFVNDKDSRVPVIVYIKNPDHINFDFKKLSYSEKELASITSYYKELFNEYDWLFKGAIKRKVW